MKREEDAIADGSIDIPMISLSQNSNLFHKRKTNADICLQRKSPFTVEHQQMDFETRREFITWEYLDDCASPIVDLETFKRNFAVFSLNQLKNLNWKNVFAAGGT